MNERLVIYCPDNPFGTIFDVNPKNAITKNQIKRQVRNLKKGETGNFECQVKECAFCGNRLMLCAIEVNDPMLSAPANLCVVSVPDQCKPFKVDSMDLDRSTTDPNTI